MHSCNISKLFCESLPATVTVTPQGKLNGQSACCVAVQLHVCLPTLLAILAQFPPLAAA
jgi:hypothetical protein